jgi:uncharacterized membrane protein YhfC
MKPSQYLFVSDSQSVTHCQTVIGYPLVNVYIAMENHRAFFMGQSTIFMAIFNIKLLVYQRVIYPHLITS